MKKIYRLINLFLIPYFLISCSRLTEPQKEKDLDKAEQKGVLCILLVSRIFGDPNRDSKSDPNTDPTLLPTLQCGYNGLKEASEIENRRVF